ncbi:DUF5301 domain-containing protein [Cytobacillus sp. S13-E01]|uniref:DUF5301 domain-containing protein n=1 Tax=Cytobacillus sp. S13-E01 TaxID=3031326 RepID=UPI0023D8A165|nr:DUF5301 domain-containing protein [Cytobacillus sp. S13-E01]MDF0729015.1 DUF5301 domain-containing protein [Cytobacillus sp. S13-E01]
MKKSLLAFASIIIVFLGIFYFYNVNKTTSLDNVLSDIDVSDITSIEIIKSSDNKEKILQNKNEINNFIQIFSQVEFKERSLKKLKFDESYWITIRENEERSVGMTIYDENYMLVYIYKPTSQNSFEILNGRSLTDIENYFK